MSEGAESSTSTKRGQEVKENRGSVFSVVKSTGKELSTSVQNVCDSDDKEILVMQKEMEAPKLDKTKLRKNKQKEESQQQLIEKRQSEEALKVSFGPPSPQAGKMTDTHGFIDLKKLKEQGNGSMMQPSDDAIPVPGDFQEKQPFVTSLKGSLHTRKHVTPGCLIPQLANLLPDPTFGHSEKQLLKKPTPRTQQPSKIFTEGPPLPISVEENADQFGAELKKDSNKAFRFEFNFKSEFSVPTSKYTEGKVKYTTKGALKDMVQDLGILDNRTTGCIVDETCAPEFDSYTKGKQFWSKHCLGRGSYGTVDLCYDSKTQKAFVRKQVAKNALRKSEIIVPTTLNHHNITKFYGLIQRGNAKGGNPTIELLIEYGGDALNKFIMDGKTLSAPQIWEASKQGLAALVHISYYSIVHLDVKPENICIAFKPDGSFVLKLTDFGSSRLPQEYFKFVGFTPEYLAPEICKMFLQLKNPGLNFGLTDADITGKVDTFAFGLVIMYLYEGYHILVKVINNGKTSYDGIDAHTRRLMQMNLMTLMADEKNSFVHCLIPDVCDLDMRDMLKKLTEHKHENRFSARDALDAIVGMEQKCKMLMIREQKIKDVTDQPLQLIDRDCQQGMDIPGIAEDCMESDYRPVKNKTTAASRMKLNPYDRAGKKGKYSNAINSKNIMSQSPYTEMHELQRGIASKQMPMTPVCEFQGLTSEQSLPEDLSEDTSSFVLMPERNASIAQPSMDTSDNQTPVPQISRPAQVFSAPQTLEPAPRFTVQQSQHVEPATGFNGIMQVPPMTDANMEPGHVVFVGGKQGTRYTNGVQRSGPFCLNLSKVTVQEWLCKNAAAQLTADIGSSTSLPSENKAPVLPTRNTKTFGDSPMKMEVEKDGGKMPLFSELF